MGSVTCSFDMNIHWEGLGESSERPIPPVCFHLSFKRLRRHGSQTIIITTDVVDKTGH